MIRIIRNAAVAAVVMGSSACSLLATPEPVQLYRFGGTATAASSDRATTPVEVSLRRVEFPQAVAGDRLLGMTGTEAAYIAGARWVGPARGLYSEALEAAFGEGATRVRLIGQRETTPAAKLLDIDVQAFEARYDAPRRNPVIVVAVRARLLNPDRTIASERLFQSAVPARENRVSAIVTAFDTAVADVNGEIVDWTDANAG
ncbi:hypothetical protein GVN24_31700 [Rhizobium sp. CRIBSB]|nr:hypothetical protein [Rhizobium sp. CRIBSB]